jgi:hypothetical protein
MQSARRLQDWLEGYLALTNNSEPPYTYRLWTGISVLAACMKRKCVLNWGDIAIYPNLYVVLVGPAGRCRKGTAMKQGLGFLREKGIKLAAESITREALVRELKNSGGNQVDVNAGNMIMHASLTVYSQELTVFLGYNNQALMADLVDWYDCGDNWTYRTKNSGTDEIIGVWVNLLGATTPELLQTTLPKDAIGGGLTSRIIFVYERNKGRTCPANFPTKEEIELKKLLIQELDSVCILSGEFRITDDFLDKYVTWYTQYSESQSYKDDYRFAGYYERRPTHLRKLCMILSASRDNSKIITAGDFDRAMEILALTERKMAYTFSGLGKSNMNEMMQRVMAYMATVKTSDFTELLQRFYQDVDKDVLEKIVESLVTMDVVRVDYAGNKKLIVYTDRKGIVEQ